MRDHHISQNSTILLNLRLHGGAPRSRNLGGYVFNMDVVQGNGSKIVDLPQYNQIPYVVEQMKQVHAMEINLSW